MSKKKKTNDLIQIIRKNGKYSKLLYATTAGQFLSSIISGTFGFLFKYLIDSMTSKDISGFTSVALILAGLFLANIPLLGMRTYFIGRYSSSVLRDMRRDIAKKAASLEISQIDTTHSGDFVSKANNDLGQIGVFFSIHMQVAMRLIISGLVSAGLMFYLNWQLTLLTFIVAPGFLYITTLIGKPLKDLVVRRNEKLAEANMVTQDTLGGYVEVRTYGLGRRLGKRLKKAIDESVRILFKSAAVETVSQGFGMFSRIIPAIVLVAVGSIFIVNNTAGATMGTVVALVVLSNWPLNLMLSMNTIVNNYKKACGSAEGLMKIFDYKDERKGGLEVPPEREGVPAISFKNVTFRYKTGQEPVIKNMDFDIYKGEKAAFVGESGSGKSTILKLIAGFYEPEEGCILINGEKLGNMDLARFRKNLSLVDQETYLFPGTLYENIACGAIGEENDVPDEKVKKAAKTTNIDSFIESLPEGYETMAFERGVRLSGGQRQRLAMARACIRDAGIIMLDEPTSALDMENEKIIQKQLDELIQDKTALIVAHRLTTIRNADKIFVFEKGRIVEEGDHDGLLEKEGKYHALLKKQFMVESEVF